MKAKIASILEDLERPISAGELWDLCKVGPTCVDHIHIPARLPSALAAPQSPCTKLLGVHGEKFVNLSSTY